MKNIIKEILTNFHKRELSELTEREINIPLNSKKIITLIGPRRSGKTFFLYQLISQIKDKTNVIYINFEDERFDFDKTNLNLILEAYFELYPEKSEKDIFIFFDEIQEVNGWEKFVRRVHDEITNKIFLTGSSAKLLSKEIATSLRGRTISYEILPLSFKEYLKFKKIEIDKHSTKGKAKITNEFKKYLEKGGFPETVFMKEEIFRKTLNDYLDVMTYRDVIERYNVKNAGALNYLIKKILTNPAGEVSVNKIFNELKSKGLRVTKDTMYDYAKYLEDAFIILGLRNYSDSIVKQSVKKFYPVDVSLSTNNFISISEETGKLLETICYLHLRRQEKKVFYFSQKNECDFIIKEKNKITYAIQVTKLLNEENKDREIKGLIEAMEKFNLREGTILTFDQEDEFKINGMKIKILPIWKWLLEGNQ